MKKATIIILCLIFAALLVSCTDNVSAEEAYTEIITEYTELLEKKQNGEKISKSSNDVIKNALLSAVNSCDDPALMGYATKDINSDGVEELFITSESYDFYALFTLDSSKPSLLKVFEGGRGALDSENIVYSWRVSENGEDRYDRYVLTKNGLEEFEVWRTPLPDGGYEYFCSLYGEERSISGGEYILHAESFNKYGSIPIKDQTRKAGLRVHLPLAESVESDAPLADASSYEGILELYKTAVSCMKDYTRTDYISGVYDEKLTFADDKAYEIFNRLIIACQMHRRRFTYSTGYMPNADNAYGYILKDIGGDGKDELILLSDTYDIIAIFATQNGSPELIFDSHYGAVSIGSGGEILVNIYYGAYHMEYRSYKINSKNELEPIDIAGHNHYPAQKTELFYTLKNGRVGFVTEEEYLASAKRIVACESEDEYHERTYLDGGFIPLFDYVNPDESYKSMRFSYSGSAYSENQIEFENITAESFDFSFRYLKIYLADPNDAAFTQEEAEIRGTARFDGNGYTFETETASGRIVFGVGIIWIDITESQEKNVECGPILLRLIEQ